MTSMFGIYQLFRRLKGLTISYRKWLAMGLVGMCFGAGSEAKADLTVDFDNGLLTLKAASTGTDRDEIYLQQ